MHICNNCDHNFEGKYCCNCGQKASVGRLHLHDLWHEGLHALTHADKGIFKLLKDLIVAPHYAYTNYFAGRRARYFSPVLFFLLMAGVNIYFGDRIFAYEDSVNQMNNEFGKFILDQTKTIGLLILPIQAIITWLFFYKRYSFVEILVFWLFCNGLVFVFRLVTVPIYFAFIDHKALLDKIFSYVGFIIMLWQLLALSRTKFPILTWLSCFIIINIVIICYHFLVGYFVFDTEIFRRDFWTTVMAAYGVV